MRDGFEPMRSGLQPLLGSPFDERLHKAVLVRQIKGIL